MELASLIQHYLPALKAKHSDLLLPGHLKAISAMLYCRTADAGQLQLRCTDCASQSVHPRSCGHRSCPKCQNHEASLWLDRQRDKLLPVEYFMAIFTLPCELRSLAWCNQTVMYNSLLPRQTGLAIGLKAIVVDQSSTHRQRRTGSVMTKPSY